MKIKIAPLRSPFRYPGGKTHLVPYVRYWLSSKEKTPDLFIEPFAGGAIVGLTVAFEQLADHVILVEIDPNVSAVWKVALGDGCSELAERIIKFNITVKNVEETLSVQYSDIIDIAFATILRNRTQHGGVLSGAGLMRHDGDSSIGCRWNARNLAKRITDIGKIKNRISFINGDAFDIVASNAANRNAVYFVDPPYPGIGKRLYTHSAIDHPFLFKQMSNVSGDFLMTYNDIPEIRQMASNVQFDTRIIAVQNKEAKINNELLLGKDLSWLKCRENQPNFG